MTSIMASRRRKATGDKLICPGGKSISFSSEEQAQDGLDRMRERARRFGRILPTRYYACELCGKYHLTHKRARALDKPKPKVRLRDLEVPEPDDGHVPALITPEGRFYNIANAAKLLGLSPGKLRRLIAQGTIQEPIPGYVSAEFIVSYTERIAS